MYDTLSSVKFVAETYQAGKLYSINIDESFEPERINQSVSELEISATSGDSPFAESIGTTQDIDTEKFVNYNRENWSRAYISTSTGQDVTSSGSSLLFKKYMRVSSNNTYRITIGEKHGIRYALYNERLEMTRYANIYENTTIQPSDDEKYIRVNIRDYLGDLSDVNFSQLGNDLIVEIIKDGDEGITSSSGIWGYGMGLIDSDDLQYSHVISSGETIDIYNAGNVTVHPFEQELNVLINGVRGSNRYFALVNKTNGTEFRTTEGIEEGNQISIGRGTVKLNGSHYLRNTTKDFIALSPGNNRFSIEGASSASVSFDFRFYYK